MFAAITLVLGLQVRSDYSSGRKFSLEEVTLTEEQFSTALNQRAKESSIDKFELLFYFPILLPEKRYFSPEAQEIIVEWLRTRQRAHGESNVPTRIASAVLHDTEMRRALQSRLVHLDDLPRFGTSTNAIRDLVSSWTETEREAYLRLRPLKIGHFRHTVLAADELNSKLAVLEALGLLDQFDLSESVEAIVRRQILDARDPQWEDIDGTRLRGLFLMSQSRPIVDTYYCLATLEKAGAIDQINREECIRGILRFHLGRGLFHAKAPDQPWRIRGDARDTYAAHESLRILGALDRVSDRHKWEYRSSRFSKKNPPLLPPGEILEAWLLRSQAGE